MIESQAHDAGTATETFQSFAEFYPYYLGEHSNTICRRLHVIGTLAGFVVAMASLALWSPLGLLLSPVVGYGFAWVGHFFFEHNKPATFRHPWWSFRGDMKLLRETLTFERPF
ncbi:MAG: DUF962 domain-containing protein [Myxococcota bacterium]